MLSFGNVGARYCCVRIEEKVSSGVKRAPAALASDLRSTNKLLKVRQARRLADNLFCAKGSSRYVTVFLKVPVFTKVSRFIRVPPSKRPHFHLSIRKRPRLDRLSRHQRMKARDEQQQLRVLITGLVLHGFALSAAGPFSVTCRPSRATNPCGVCLVRKSPRETDRNCTRPGRARSISFRTSWRCTTRETQRPARPAPGPSPPRAWSPPRPSGTSKLGSCGRGSTGSCSPWPGEDRRVLTRGGRYGTQVLGIVLSGRFWIGCGPSWAMQPHHGAHRRMRKTTLAVCSDTNTFFPQFEMRCCRYSHHNALRTASDLLLA